jgi:predicted adenylyl cyclase CyaB
MARNVEVKARVRDIEKLSARAESLAGEPAQVIEQHDTFFSTARGRLKLRRLGPEQGELIAYDRGDTEVPRLSSYTIVPTDHPDELADVLAQHLPVRGAVRKLRRLYLIGQTRVHLDAVEGLGSFVELEVVLRPDQSPEEGVAVVYDLMDRLGIAPADLVAHAYIDLLEERHA